MNLELVKRDEVGLPLRPPDRQKSVQKDEGLGEGSGGGSAEQQCSPQDMVAPDV